jgi:aldose 1-epimerase
VTTDQPAIQLYSCDGLFNATAPIPRKASQGGPLAHYTDWSCVVIEQVSRHALTVLSRALTRALQESWIDAINQPQWGVNQIYGPKRDYNWNSVYQFSVMH